MLFKLNKNITLASGDVIAELDLDFDNLSFLDLKNAKKVCAWLEPNATSANVDSTALSPRLDANFRIGLAWIAAMKSNSKLNVNDVLLLSAKDALLLSEEALNFLF